MSLISVRAVMQARFVRSAIEVETVRLACDLLTDDDFDALQALLAQQREASDAGDFAAFHALDDQFHRTICERTGNGFV